MGYGIGFSATRGSREARQPRAMRRNSFGVNAGESKVIRSDHPAVCTERGWARADRLQRDVGNDKWDIPGHRNLLEEILPGNSSFDDFEVTHGLPSLGRRVMKLNARHLDQEQYDAQFTLLAIEVIPPGERGYS